MPMSPPVPALAEEAHPPHLERPIAAPPTSAQPPGPQPPGSSTRPRRRLGRTARISVLVVALAAVGAGCDYDVFGATPSSANGIGRAATAAAVPLRLRPRRRLPRCPAHPRRSIGTPSRTARRAGAGTTQDPRMSAGSGCGRPTGRTTAGSSTRRPPTSRPRSSRSRSRTTCGSQAALGLPNR